MLLHIGQVLNLEQLGQLKTLLSATEFEDGKNTAPGAGLLGHKKNLQLTPTMRQHQAPWDFIRNILKADSRISELTHVKTILPVIFSRYEPGMYYQTHVDRPLMSFDNNHIRTDISMTLFLNSPDEYEGGELVIESDYGTSVCKENAGDLVLYPSNMLHEVKPVTKGQRLVAIGWIQSLIRDSQQRRILFDLNTLISQMEKESQPGVMIAKKTYFNLLRLWVDM